MPPPDGDIEAVAVLYAAAELERLRVHEVMDRLVELWLAGGLAIGPGRAAQRLDAYWLESNERTSSDERRDIYRRLFGDGNRAFEDIWPRLLAALAGRSAAAAATAALDLQANLSEHLDEDMRAAAPVLHAQISGALEVMTHPDILGAYGAEDVWQLVEHLIRRDGGQPPADILRVQAGAAAGAAVLGWLAGGSAVLDDVVADAAAACLAARAGG